MLFSRTNYFAVADPDEFLDWAGRLPDIELRRDGQGHFSIVSTDPDTGEMPDMIQLPGTEDVAFCLFQHELQKRLAPGTVVIVYSVGEAPNFPGHPYGQATALHASGRTLRLNLQDIIAMSSWTLETTPLDLPPEETNAVNVLDKSQRLP